MEVEVKDTIRDIDEQEWNSLVGTEYPDRTHAWFRTIEDSGIATLQYITISENAHLEAAACTYRYFETLHGITMPFLEARCPTGAGMGFFSKNTEHTETLLKGMEEIKKKKKVIGMIISGFPKEDSIFVENQMKKYIPFNEMERMYIDLNFRDFEDYLSSLNASNRRSIRKTLNRTARWEITHIITNDFLQWKGVCHRLQKSLCAQHKDFRLNLTEQFYEAVERNFKEHAELTLFFRGDIPLACGLSLNSSTISIHKFAGVDPEHRDYQAYFLLYYEGIRRALERKQKRIYFGTTTYEFKEKIGCKREELFGFIRISNPLLNLALKSYMKMAVKVGKRF